MTNTSSEPCSRCGTTLPPSARVCPLCGMARENEVPDQLRQTRDEQTARGEIVRVKRFPRWLYRVGIGAVMFAVAVFVASLFGLTLPLLFLGGALLWLWIMMALAGIIGAMLLLIATFGPWPLEE